ncbi:SIR2 family protein [Arenibacter sp. M-2]|uniref:SIR2 family protein n=1 Tax=Arenibacter sp. M-2 TaxID=3053612 RepID=UPI002570B11C|nr:SIR2 family protein [Arenibacter sp. M-2]MDL5511733.1 SIR2 family protein [Arenibacter sp. M-2]
MKRRKKNLNACKTLSDHPKQIFLFGNGINKGVKDLETTSTFYVGWEDILDSLNNKYADGRINEIYKKPFPLAYDEIVNYNFSHKTNDEIEIKKFIQIEVGKIKLNPRYEDLPKLRYDEILTTNYDYLFEKALNIEWKRKNNFGHREISFSCYRRQELNEKKIWHIHGEQCSYSSILFGFRHYINYSARVKKQAHDDLFSLKNKIHLSDQKSSWVKYFFTDNIRIVGLSMKHTEYPLYWVLAYRNYLKESHPAYIIKNRIEYFIPSFSIEKNRNILEALSSYGVIIRSFELENGDYDGFYKAVFNNRLGEIYNIY